MRPATLARKLARSVVLLLLVALGTIALIRFAPGYFADARELDPRFGQHALATAAAQEAAPSGLLTLARAQFSAWLHGDLGTSRQYDIPVTQLLHQRAAVTASLLFRGIALGWLLALATALPISRLRRGSALASLPLTLLLAIPVAAMATACLLSNHGGATLVLAAVVAARDFKFLRRALIDEWSQPHLLMARALGLRWPQVLFRHIAPRLAAQCLSLATLSLVTALSALVPIEVLFDLPGLGQLAWSAAMNRDIPVLLAVTLLVALCVSLAGMISDAASLQPQEATL